MDVSKADFKFSKTVDQGTYFCHKEKFVQGQYRTDFAKIAADKCVIIEIDCQQHRDILLNTEISESQKKIDFLLTYVPKLRLLPKPIIEDTESYFIKE